MTDIGHNIGVDRLRSLVERIERLESEKKALQEDIKGVYQEGKSAGYDVRALRQLIRIRATDPQKLREQEELLDLYRTAMGDA